MLCPPDIHSRYAVTRRFIRRLLMLAAHTTADAASAIACPRVFLLSDIDFAISHSPPSI